MNPVLLYGGLAAALLATGCAMRPTVHASTAPEPRASVAVFPPPVIPGERPLRVIITFSDPALDPSAPAFLSRLSAETGEHFTYVRPLAGGAHLLVTDRPMKPAERTALIRRLAARADTARVEEDAIITIQ